MIVIAPRDSWYEKTVSNLQEVKALAHDRRHWHAGDEKLEGIADIYYPAAIREKKDDGTPALDESLLPFLAAPLLQMFSYKMAVMRAPTSISPEFWPRCHGRVDRLIRNSLHAFSKGWFR